MPEHEEVLDGESSRLPGGTIRVVTDDELVKLVQQYIVDATGSKSIGKMRRAWTSHRTGSMRALEPSKGGHIVGAWRD